MKSQHSDMRKQWMLATAAVAGVALFAWTIWSVGPAVLLTQLRSLAPALSFIVVLAGVRFLLQAAGWRLALPAEQRAGWREMFGAVVAGEAAGYFAWGPISREPTKALLLQHRMPQRTALTAAVVERFYYSIAATMLIVAAVALCAVRYHFVKWFLLGLTVAVMVAVVARSYWNRFSIAHSPSRASTFGLLALALAQEISNLTEAYVVLAWLGAAPTIVSVVVLEGIGRLMNGAGQFVPGKLGVTEAATTALAESLRLGGPQGLSLALARRARSLVWGAGGIGWLTYRGASGIVARKPLEATV
jgi:lysylphosphatidylglycerol synthase-like protein